jgi:predicted kinase
MTMTTIGLNDGIKGRQGIMDKFFNIELCDKCIRPYSEGLCSCHNRNPILILTMGLPRSGKSSYCRELISQGVPVVNPDSVRLALHGQPFIPSAETMIWALAKYAVKSLFEVGHRVVAVDATNTTEHARNNWKSIQWSRNIVYFQTSKEECIRRAVASDKEYLCDVIENMHEQLTIPSSDELSDDERFMIYED